MLLHWSSVILSSRKYALGDPASSKGSWQAKGDLDMAGYTTSPGQAENKRGFSGFRKEVKSCTLGAVPHSSFFYPWELV